jgi:hypothetical protein
VGEMKERGSHNNRWELKAGEYQHSKYPRLTEHIEFRTILFPSIRNK